MSLFGSVISDRFTASSDIDILVEFDPKHIPGLFGLAGMRNCLSGYLGRNVDLRTPEDLSVFFRNEVIQESYPIYGKKDLNRLNHIVDAAKAIQKHVTEKNSPTWIRIDYF